MSNLTTVNEHGVVTPMPAQEQSMASRILEMASDPNFDVEKLDRLMDLQEREMNRLAKIAFNKDFTAMQADITTVSKGNKVGYESRGTKVGYSFATLEDIVDMVRPVLQEYGFAISFKVDTSNGVKVNCSLMHKEGHSIDTTMQLPPDSSGGKNNVQALGSSISYAKRYTLSSILNIATRDDDDAQSAMQKDQRTITAGQSKTLEAKFNKLPADRQDSFTHWLMSNQGVDSIPEVQVNGFNAVLAGLNKVVASLDREVSA